jgi:hypothetical protein
MDFAHLRLCSVVQIDQRKRSQEAPPRAQLHRVHIVFSKVRG